MKAWVLAAVLHSLQHLRALDCDGGGGNPWLRLVVAERARVRRLKTDGRDRADDCGDRAVLRRARRARASVLYCRAVVCERHVVDDYLATKRLARAFEFVEAVDDERFGRDAF